MILLQNKTLIISYNPYQYKDGGFCITINPKNKIQKEDLELTNDQINELLKPTAPNKNKVPIYKELLEKYFNEQLNFEL